ncbi:MAG: hypothetical protein H0T69_08350 [Thermoleophilaceae bacterium]|nr:hypothetical protein [Thermoleophilaceae bacterium]
MTGSPSRNWCTATPSASTPSCCASSPTPTRRRRSRRRPSCAPGAASTSSSCAPASSPGSTPRIGINEAKRRAERRPPPGTVSSIEDSPIEDAPDWSEAPEFQAEQGQLRRLLEDAVRTLPLEYRTPLILRDVEGLSTDEAAEVMELGEAAFKSRLHRARLVVRRAVDEYYLESDQ